jgi:hypothetical protein
LIHDARTTLKIIRRAKYLSCLISPTENNPTAACDCKTAENPPNIDVAPVFLIMHEI